MKNFVGSCGRSPRRVSWRAALVVAACGVCSVPVAAQIGAARPARTAKARTAARAETNLTGVFRLDPLASDKLYTIVTEADTNLPYARQTRFFDDLIVRLSSPDQLAIERRGALVRIASSRAPRLTLRTDAAPRTEIDPAGGETRTRAFFRDDEFVFSSVGGDDEFEVTFQLFDDGRRLRVTRRITTAGLNQPVVVRSIYNRVSDVARWDIYAGAPAADLARNQPTGESARNAEGDPAAIGSSPTTRNAPAAAAPVVIATTPATDSARRPLAELARNSSNAYAEVDALRASLGAWLAATNSVDINRQLDFYSTRVGAYYLARDVTLASVRREKERTFRGASRVEITAGEPEIIFADAGRTAIMRFRKRYTIDSARAQRRGEVVQELRWRRTPDGWRIFSERDVRVVR